jgi:hypothetical protein
MEFCFKAEKRFNIEKFVMHEVRLLVPCVVEDGSWMMRDEGHEAAPRVHH